MTFRPVAAFAFLLLPGVLTAQRFPTPRIGWDGPTRPAPLPPQPAVIARELAYKRLRVAVESYPLVSYIETSGMSNSRMSSWTSFGMGTRVDYRVHPNVSATIDMTSSFLGGPANTQTAEIGGRLRPERNDRRLYPFFDLRVGYVNSYSTYFRPNDIYGNPTYISASAARFSQGIGGAAGAGLEIALTRTLSLTNAASVMRGRLTGYSHNSTFTRGAFSMTAYRYTIGLRYNPVRVTVLPPVAGT